MALEELCNPDEIKVGDRLDPYPNINTYGHPAPVLETQVIDTDRMEAGVRTRTPVGNSDFVSYEDLAERDFVVYRDWTELTEEQIQELG